MQLCSFVAVTIRIVASFLFVTQIATSDRTQRANQETVCLKFLCVNTDVGPAQTAVTTVANLLIFICSFT